MALPERARAALAGALALGALLRVPGLARESFWLDELSAVRVASLDLPGLFAHLVTRDVHPPLYFLLLKAWLPLAGTDERGARSLSALLGLGAVLATAWVVHALRPHRGAALAAALTATAPALVYYAREARGYALLHLFTALALGCLLRVLRSPSAGHLGGLAAALLGLLYTHPFGALTALALACAGAPAVLGVGAPRARWALAFGAVAALFLPWVPAALGQAGRVQEGFWIAPPDPAGWLLWVLREGPLSVLYVLVLTAAAGAGWRALGDLPRERAALVWVSLLPVLLALGASWVGQPIFLGKYALGSLAAVHALAAVGLAGVPGRGWAAALVALGFAESARDAHCARHRADWRALARFAAEASVRGEGPVVLSSPYSEHLAVYLPRAVAVPYLPPEGVASLARGAPAGLWVLDVHPARTPGALTAALRCCFQPGRSRVFYLARATHWERASAGAAPRL